MGKKAKRLGIGRLLLKRLASTPSRRARPASVPESARGRLPMERDDPNGPKRDRREQRRAAASRFKPVLPKPRKTQRAAATPAPVAPPQGQQVVLVPQPSPVPAIAPGDDPSGRALSLQDLIRPGDALRQSIEAFLMDQRSTHTQRAYGKDLKRFVQFLHARQFRGGPGKLDRATLIAYKDSLLSEGLEHTTVDRHLATLRSFFRWLVDDGHLAKNPAEGVRFMNPKRVSRTIGFTDEEVRKVLARPDLHTRTGAMHYAILMVLFYCGLRRSELCALRTSSLGIERSHHVIRLRGKGDAERVVVMIPAVWNAIRHYLRIVGKEVLKDQPLFAPVRNNRGGGDCAKPLDSSMIFYVVTKYAKQAGVANRVSPHSCRATAISNARDRNVPDRAIQEFAGWASPDMITRYDKRKSAVEKSAALAIHYGSEDRELPSVPADPAKGLDASGNPGGRRL